MAVTPDFWNGVISEVLIRNNMTIFKVLSDGTEVPHPSESGLFRKSIGEMKGQIADWRASISGSDKGVHVVEFRDCYRIHVDEYDPHKKPVEHLIHDSPKTGAALAIAGIGVLVASKLISGWKKRRL